MKILLNLVVAMDELGSVLAVNNPTRQFSLYDLIPGTNMLNDKYKISNLKFFERKIQTRYKLIQKQKKFMYCKNGTCIS